MAFVWGGVQARCALARELLPWRIGVLARGPCAHAVGPLEGLASPRISCVSGARRAASCGGAQGCRAAFGRVDRTRADACGQACGPSCASTQTSRACAGGARCFEP